MTYEIKDGKVCISLSGRIDSSNADAVEKELNETRDAAKDGDLILDLDDLSYISSAGLRIILRLRKKEPSLKLINASSEVYDIFDMTGFTEMIPVEKAYRKLSVDGCEVIGTGANGIVYRLDPDTIIKVYKNADSLPDIHRERELARRAFVSGVPTAIPYDVVRVGDSYGSVFELLNAKSITKLIIADPDNLEKYVDMYVELAKTIHSTDVNPDDMPSMKEVAVGWAEFLRDYLPEDKADKLVKLVSAVPDVKKMMHGDYHTKNVMVQNGEVLLIDMDTLCYGHPVFEFASVYNAYIGFSLFDHSIIEQFQGFNFETGMKIWDMTIRKYFGTDDAEKLREITDKSIIVGLTRLIRRSVRRGGLDTDEGKAQIEAYKKMLIEALDRVDTLEF